MKKLKTKIQKIVTVVVFFAVAIHAYSQYPTYLNPISLSYGAAYRFDNKYRHVITLDKWYFRSTCLTSSYYGFGVSTEFTDITNFNLGIRYYRSPNIYKRMLLHYPILFYAIAPTVYSIQGNQGVSIAPEIGFHPFIKLKHNIGIGILIYYGYDIPIINKQDYTLSKHRLTIKFSIDKHRLTYKKPCIDSTTTK